MADGQVSGALPLPEDGEAVIASVRLPAGKRVMPTGEYGNWAQPALWVTGAFEDAAVTWLALRERLGGGSGLVPLLLSGLSRQPGRPWESGELGPQEFTDLASLQPSDVLRDGWDRGVPDPAEDEEETAKFLAPFSRSFPGLAPAASDLASPAALKQAVDVLTSIRGPLRIGLVVADRPADALVSIGWLGAINEQDSAAPLAVILRSWEERFGATLMHVGYDTMDLLVQRPVPSQREAPAVAAEHYAFCYDNIAQGAGSISAYARDLPGETLWSFWWD